MRATVSVLRAQCHVPFARCLSKPRRSSSPLDEACKASGGDEEACPFCKSETTLPHRLSAEAFTHALTPSRPHGPSSCSSSQSDIHTHGRCPCRCTRVKSHPRLPLPLPRCRCRCACPSTSNRHNLTSPPRLSLRALLCRLCHCSTTSRKGQHPLPERGKL